MRGFPQRVNAGYMQIVDRATIRLRVCERGAGETLACGTARAPRWSPASGAGCSTRAVRSQTRGGELDDSMAGGGQARADDRARRRRYSKARSRCRAA